MRAPWVLGSGTGCLGREFAVLPLGFLLRASGVVRLVFLVSSVALWVCVRVRRRAAAQVVDGQVPHFVCVFGRGSSEAFIEQCKGILSGRYPRATVQRTTWGHYVRQQRGSPVRCTQ